MSFATTRSTAAGHCARTQTAIPPGHASPLQLYQIMKTPASRKRLNRLPQHQQSQQRPAEQQRRTRFRDA